MATSTHAWLEKLGLDATALKRADESPDAGYYRRPRLVSHLDSAASGIVERILETLVVDKVPSVLDLMASCDSHLGLLEEDRAVGLGLNLQELRVNERLTGAVVQDLNAELRLPFADEVFDVVLNTVSVDYLVQPIEVFQEACRVLRPGGLLLVVFSNRFFPPKVVEVWRDATESERQRLVEAMFAEVEDLGPIQSVEWTGRPRPADDPYADRGIPADPIYAMWAEKRGGPEGLERPEVVLDDPRPWGPEEVARRKTEIATTLECPHCGAALSKWPVPQTPFTEWPEEYLWVCLEDECAFYVCGWQTMAKQGIADMSYRFWYSADRDTCGAAPVHGAGDMKPGRPKG